jgi:hypothetical protein
MSDDTIRVVIEDDEGGASSPSRDRVAEAERRTNEWLAEAARLRQQANHDRFVAARVQVDAGLRQTTAEA